jgi:hypothetical protein
MPDQVLTIDSATSNIAGRLTAGHDDKDWVNGVELARIGRYDRGPRAALRDRAIR